MIRKEKGFTLIELVLVIAILGILAVAALPTFINVTAQAEQAARDGVVGSIRSGIMLFRANLIATAQTPAWPTAAELGPDAAANDCVAANPCFEGILQGGGIIDTRWTVTVDNTTYVFDAGGDNETTYVYDPVTGQFDQQ